jgi:hypothetical protein
VIGPSGVFVIDSKQNRGRLQLDPSGWLWHGRYLLVSAVQAVSFEADQAAVVLTDPEVVVPIMAIHGTQVPWGKVVMNGVPVVSARRLPSMLRAPPGGAGARAGRRPGRPGPDPLLPCRLTHNACRIMVTSHPVGDWVTQSADGPQDCVGRFRFLLRDRDTNFTAAFDAAWHPVQQLPPNRAHPPLRVAVGSLRPHRRA